MQVAGGHSVGWPHGGAFARCLSLLSPSPRCWRSGTWAPSEQTASPLRAAAAGGWGGEPYFYFARRLHFGATSEHDPSPIAAI